MTAMRYLMQLLFLIPSCAMAQQLPVEDRACIIAAIGKLPRTLKVEGSRVLEINRTPITP